MCGKGHNITASNSSDWDYLFIYFISGISYKRNLRGEVFDVTLPRMTLNSWFSRLCLPGARFHACVTVPSLHKRNGAVCCILSDGI